MPATLSQRIAAVCSRIQAGSQHFSIARVGISGCAPSQRGSFAFFCPLFCRIWCCAPSLSGWEEWKCLEILASPGQQELLDVLAETRTCVPSGWPNTGLDNVKGQGRSLRVSIRLAWGSLLVRSAVDAISSFCTRWC